MQKSCVFCRAQTIAKEYCRFSSALARLISYTINERLRHCAKTSTVIRRTKNLWWNISFTETHSFIYIFIAVNLFCRVFWFSGVVSWLFGKPQKAVSSIVKVCVYSSKLFICLNFVCVSINAMHEWAHMYVNYIYVAVIVQHSTGFMLHVPINGYTW